MPTDTVRPTGPIAGPKPRVVAVIVPTTVFALLLAVLAWSAWHIVSPAREVQVVQAVFDRSGIDRASPTTADAQPAREVPTVQAPGWLEA